MMADDPDKQKKKKPGAPKSKVVQGRNAMLLGLGLDNEDGHTRVTSGKNFKLLGGSKDTHEAMQETALKVNEELDRRHKRLEEVHPQEFLDILHKARA